MRAVKVELERLTKGVSVSMFEHPQHTHPQHPRT